MFSNLDENHNVVQTLQDISEAGDNAIDAIENLSNLVDQINEFKHRGNIILKQYYFRNIVSMLVVRILKVSEPLVILQPRRR